MDAWGGSPSPTNLCQAIYGWNILWYIDGIEKKEERRKEKKTDMMKKATKKKEEEDWYDEKGYKGW